eukprot:861444-Prymnesium_polylepis.1
MGHRAFLRAGSVLFDCRSIKNNWRTPRRSFCARAANIHMQSKRLPARLSRLKQRAQRTCTSCASTFATDYAGKNPTCAACRKKTVRDRQPYTKGWPTTAATSSDCSGASADWSSVLVDPDLLPQVLASLFRTDGVRLLLLSRVCRCWHATLREEIARWQANVSATDFLPPPAPIGDRPRLQALAFAARGGICGDGFATTCFGAVNIFSASGEHQR